MKKKKKKKKKIFNEKEGTKTLKIKKNEMYLCMGCIQKFPD